MLKKDKKEYYKNLDLHVTDTKTCRKTEKPVFGDKLKTCNTISLIEKSIFITSEKALANTLNEFFVNIVQNPGIDAYKVSGVTTSDKNSLTSIIEKYHPSIKAIKNHMDKIEKPKFNFKEIAKPLVV